MVNCIQRDCSKYQQTDWDPELQIAVFFVVDGHKFQHPPCIYVLFYKQLPGGCQVSSFGRIIRDPEIVRFRTDLVASVGKFSD